MEGGSSNIFAAMKTLDLVSSLRRKVQRLKSSRNKLKKLSIFWKIKRRKLHIRTKRKLSRSCVRNIMA
ncbi:hypothetical protein CFP56_002019 [Quercus suber]|uniref:Uncharacterized protein n=1 Tax=Quercus suber TaxID=58331 RepID=A0AAW0IL65_QUESU